MVRLSKALEYYYAGNRERKKLLSKDPAFNSYSDDRKELILTEAEYPETLVNIGIQEALVQGSKKKRVIRNALPVFNTEDYKLQLPSDTSPNDCAPIVSEGGQYPKIGSPYTSGAIDTKTFGLRPSITNEMVEDADWNIIETEVKRAGSRIENALNREGISKLLSGHGGSPSDIDPATHITSDDVLEAKARIVSNGYGKDFSIITHPVSGSQYLYNNAGYSNVFSDDTKIWRINPFELAINTYNDTTEKWDYTVASNHYYGIVFDADNYAAIAMRHDIKASKEIKDPVRDLVNVKVSMRAGVNVINDDAACLILTK